MSKERMQEAIELVEIITREAKLDRVGLSIITEELTKEYKLTDIITSLGREKVLAQFSLSEIGAAHYRRS